ncbi:MAG: glutathione S-transferase family protein [Planctomycetota bacterium]|nr:glutathione S-transferase family protein [Planctomycetota bacterium]
MLKFHELGPSPNNVKVRLALRYKGIPFEAIPVDAVDRSSVRAVSGQDLTPVIEDRNVIVVDSEAILHYLDANYPETPRCFPRDREGRKDADAWKRTLDETVGRPFLAWFREILKRNPEATERIRSDFRAAYRALESKLDGRPALAESPDDAVRDLRVAQWALYPFPSDALVERVRLFGRFREIFGLDPAEHPAIVRFLEPWGERMG